MLFRSKEMTGYDQSQNRLVNDLDRMNSKLIQCRGRFEDEDENVTSGMPFKICDSCVGRMNKIIWDEFPYQDMSDEQG